MPQSKSVALAFAIGTAAVVGPIWASVQLAWNESVSTEKALGLSYAHDVLRRTQETASQFSTAIQQLNTDGYAPCSQAAQGSPCRFLADRFRRFEVCQPARARPPAVALHRAVHILGQGSCRDTGVTRSVSALKAARVDQRHAPGGSVKASSVAVGDARIGP